MFHLKFRDRILLFSLTLLVVFLIGALAVAQLVLSGTQGTVYTQSLYKGSEAFEAVVDQRFNRLERFAGIMSRGGHFDYLAPGDSGAEARYREYLPVLRAGFDMDLVGVASVETGQGHFAGRGRGGISQTPFMPLSHLGKTGKREDFRGIAMQDGVYYQVFMTPTSGTAGADEDTTYIVLGYAINDKLISDFQQVTLVDVTMLRISKAPAGDGVMADILHSSLDTRLRTDLQQVLVDGKSWSKRDHWAWPHDISLNGLGYGLVVRQIEKSDLYMAYATRTYSLFGILQQYAIQLCLFFGILVFLLFRMARVMAGRVVRPVNALIAAAGEVVDGNLDVRVDDSRSDEIGQLGRAFNHMVEGLSEREKLRWQAEHDAVTGLANRRRFMRHMNIAVENFETARELAVVMMIDLDGFKPVNDTYGHAAGDEILKAVANRLRDFAGPEGLASRFGGDEFVLLRTGLDGEHEITPLADRLLEQVALPVVFEGNKLSVGASVGIAVLRDGENPADWLERADAAVYDAKAAGKGCWCMARNKPRRKPKPKPPAATEGAPDTQGEPEERRSWRAQKPGEAPDSTIPSVSDEPATKSKN